MNNNLRYPRTRLEAFPLYPDDTYHSAPKTRPWMRVVGRFSCIALSATLIATCMGYAVHLYMGA
jgi:hypothetical protein